MITARVTKASDDECTWLQHDLELGAEYEVHAIEMGGYYTSVYLVGKKHSYNSVYFDFYENGGKIDIYSDKRFNPYF